MRRGEDVGEATTNSGLVGFQTVLLMLIFKLHSRFQGEDDEGSCIILSPLFFTSNLVMHNHHEKTPTQSFLGP